MRTQFFNIFIQRFWRQPEGAPVDGDRHPGFQQFREADHFIGRQVALSHQPLGLGGTQGQKGGIHSFIGGEIIPPAGISGEENFRSIQGDQVAVTGAETEPGEAKPHMSDRKGVHVEPLRNPVGRPVEELDDGISDKTGNERAQSFRNDDRDPRRKVLEGMDVQVVVVGVGDQDGLRFRHVAGRHSQIILPAQTEDFTAENGIGDERRIARVQMHCRVTDVCDPR